MHLAIAAVVLFLGGVMGPATGHAENATQPKSEPLQGTMNVDEKFAFPSQVLAYRAVESILLDFKEDLAGQSRLDSITTLVVFSEKEFSTVAAYEPALEQIQALVHRYQILLPPLPQEGTTRAGIAGLPAAATLFLSLADVVAPFRTDVDIKGVATTVDRTAIVAELARILGKNVIYPPVYVPHGLHKGKADSSPLMRALGELLQYRNHSSQQLAKTKSEDPLAKQLQSTNDQVDSLIAAFTKPDDKTGISMLTCLFRAEALRDVLRQEGTRILVMEVNASGGANKTTRNLFTVFSGSRLSHTGGAVITFLLLDRDGAQFDFSRMYWAETDFVKVRSKDVHMMTSRAIGSGDGNHSPGDGRAASAQ